MSDYAALKIPELDFEAPYRRQSFGVTTVEGVITKVKEMIEKFMVYMAWESNVRFPLKSESD